jgi:hypothetical protein
MLGARSPVSFRWFTRSNVETTAKVIGSAAILLAVLTLFTTYGLKRQERFNETKPLFDLCPEEKGKPILEEGGKIRFTIRNKGGWTMFMGVASDIYREARNDRGIPARKPPLCTQDQVLFDKTPYRWQVSDKSAGCLAFEVRCQKEVDGCTHLLGWIDADSNFFEQSIVIRCAPLESERVSLGNPLFRRTRTGWGLGRVLDDLPIEDLEWRDLPFGEEFPPETNFVVWDSAPALPEADSQHPSAP